MKPDSSRKTLSTLIALLSILSTCVYSQNTPKRDYISNHMLWTSLGIQGKIKNNFSYQLDLEYRRQADPMHAAEPNTSVGNSHYNVFKNPYQFAIRPWVLYQLNQNIVFAVSPITWFGTWASPVNDVTSFQPEFRTSFQVTLTNSFGKLQVSHRYRYEARYFGLKEIDDGGQVFGPRSSYDFPKANQQGRLRYMLRLTLPLNNKTIQTRTYYAIANAEILLKTGKNINNANLIDQFRTYGGFGYKNSTNTRIEVGYLNAVAFKLNNTAKNNVDVNNILWVKFIFDNFNNIFVKKKSETKFMPNDD